MNKQMKDTPESALYAAFLILVETLDKRGVLSAADLVTSIGESLDFRAKTNPDFNNSNLREIYDHLLSVEKTRLEIETLKAQTAALHAKTQALKSRKPFDPDAPSSGT